MRETKKGHTNNLPLKSTQPLLDKIVNRNGRTCMCYIFLNNSTLQVHQDIDNSRNQKNKDHHTCKHSLLQEQSDFTT